MFRHRRRGRLPLLVLFLGVALLALRQWNAPDTSGGDGAAATSTRSTPVSVDGARSPPRSGPYPVVHVVDGDTLDVSIPGNASSLRSKERIRLLRINTPERDEPGYERATAALSALVEGRDVELEFEQPGKAEPDEYGRLLAYIVLDGVNVNVELVRGGFTRFFTKYGEGRHAEEFRAAEEQARAKNAGLWSEAGWNTIGRDELKKKRGK